MSWIGLQSSGVLRKWLKPAVSSSFWCWHSGMLRGMLVCLPITSPAETWRERKRALLKKCNVDEHLCWIIETSYKGRHCRGKSWRSITFQKYHGWICLWQRMCHQCKTKVKFRVYGRIRVSICFSVINMTNKIFRIGHAAMSALNWFGKKHIWK